MTHPLQAGIKRLRRNIMPVLTLHVVEPISSYSSAAHRVPEAVQSAFNIEFIFPKNTLQV